MRRSEAELQAQVRWNREEIKKLKRRIMELKVVQSEVTALDSSVHSDIDNIEDRLEQLETQSASNTLAIVNIEARLTIIEASLL